MNERNDQIKKVLSDETFVKSLLEAENEEAAQKMLADKGVELSLTEIELMGEMLEAVQEGKITAEQLEKVTRSGELSEDELETAAGGSVRDFFYELVPNSRTFSDGTPFAAIEVLQTNRVAAAVGVGVLAAVGIGYGAYDAVRRRW